MAKFVLRIEVDVESEFGGELSPVDLRRVMMDARDTVESRLFGEGFLPDDVVVRSFSVTY